MKVDLPLEIDFLVSYGGGGGGVVMARWEVETRMPRSVHVVVAG